MYNETALPPKPSFSLRRTISADMSSSSSQKWLQIKNSSSAMIKRAQSSDRLDALDHQEEEPQDREEHGHEDLHVGETKSMSNNKNEEEKKGAFDDIWSSILSNKKSDSGSGSGSGSGSDNTPYVHPLVKRTTSSLSEKSLEICTENLGSETGSDGFGSSEESDSTHPDLHVDPVCNSSVTINNYVEQYNYYVDDHPTHIHTVYKRAPPTPARSVSSSLSSSTSASSFPPPLPSLTHRLQSHRHGGRLVVEAVSVPTTTCRLRAQRRDGRLLLTLSSSDDVADGNDIPMRQVAQDNKDEDYDGNGNGNEKDNYENSKKKLTIEFMMEEEQASCCRMIMSKVIGARQPRNFNTTVIKSLDDDDNEEILPMIPPPVNTYEYYWRRNHYYPHHHNNNNTGVLKPVVFTTHNSNDNNNNNNNNNSTWVLGRTGNKITAQVQAQTRAENKVEVEMEVKLKEIVVVEKAGEYLVPFFRGCKETKRSLLCWEPHCIATS